MKIKKNKDKKEANVNIIDKTPKEPLSVGDRTLKDLITPSAIDRSNAEYLKVDDKFVKVFSINGYPSNVTVGWLDPLYSYDGYLDVAFYIEPADERGALDELTKKITQFEAELIKELEKGNVRHVTRLQNKVQQLYAQREKLEQNYESLFYIQIMCALYADSLDQLNKEYRKLENKMKGRRITISPLILKQDDGYKSTLPFGKTYLSDYSRNFNSGALTSCFPFYNSEISHENGIFIGVNLSTNTPALIDFFDKNLLTNSNITVFGKSGSGKTFFVSLLTLRSILKGIRNVIIDPEGEYSELANSVGGTVIEISPESLTKINPFDIEDEEETDDNGNPTGQTTLKLKEKISDMINLIAVMSGGLTREQSSIVSTIIGELYQERGITEDPSSIYIKKPIFDVNSGEFYHDNIKKEMPTFSDFHNKLIEYSKNENLKNLSELANALSMFKRDEIYGMFDCQTSINVNFKKDPLIIFDVSKLEESVLRPIGMYIALSWTWEKFVKKNPESKKFVICDEAWMLMDESNSGHEYTSAFINKSARRIRKRNAGLIVASQSFKEFANNPNGRAVLNNASVNIFLKQDSSDIDEVQTLFKLSDGEKDFLLSANKGEALIKMGDESSVVFALSFPYEQKLIEKKFTNNNNDNNKS